MHVKQTVARSGGKTYRYTLLVKSVRDANGKPTHEVIANLGDLDPKVVASLKAALASARKKKSKKPPSQGKTPTKARTSSASNSDASEKKKEGQKT